MEFDFDLRRSSGRQRKDDTPFSILVLGEFSGNLREGSDIAAAITRKVDIDNIDDLWRLFEPGLALDINGARFEFEPRDLDHFHPDHLYHHLPVFRDMRQLRKRLLDPDTSDETLAGILSTGAVTDEPETGLGEGDPPPAPPESGDNMFERLLGERSTERKPAPIAAAQSNLDNLIREIVAPHIVHELNPQVDAAVDSVDLGIAELMRSVLHDPDFQALESAWRSLYELVHRVETDETMEIRICNVGKAALLDALPVSGDGLEDSTIYHKLVTQYRIGADSRTPSVIAGNYYFGISADDIVLLAVLGSIADTNDSVFLAAANPEVIGAASLPDQPDFKTWSDATDRNPMWKQLRESPFASRIGLALPRILARLPYGKDTEEIDSFDFEEMPSPQHGSYLWANPTLAMCGLLAGSFVQFGWSMSPGGAMDIGELPAHSYRVDGETKMQPCAELLLPESSAEAILGKGIMPIVSFKNQDMARVLRFQSIADPLAGLAGPWESHS
jgi:type VI secretion system protein ImpC